MDIFEKSGKLLTVAEVIKLLPLATVNRVEVIDNTNPDCVDYDLCEEHQFDI